MVSKIDNAMQVMKDRLFPIYKKDEVMGEFYSLLSWEENEILLIQEFGLKGKYKKKFLTRSQRWGDSSLL